MKSGYSFRIKIKIFIVYNLKMGEYKKEFMNEAIQLSHDNIMAWKGWPFWAVVVKDWKIVWRWANHVTSENDPTAHAEVSAIRDACKNLGTFQLDWCEIYANSEPCPMCLWAIYRARPDKVYYANDQNDAAAINFDDHFIYEEIEKDKADRKIPMIKVDNDEAIRVFEEWKNKQDKIEY